MTENTGCPIPGGQRYVIAKVPVDFPFKAYPTQIAMMSKVIVALEKSQNAILEAPTGSGKSLSLLCSSLSWRNEFRAKFTAVDDQPPSLQDERPLKPGASRAALKTGGSVGAKLSVKRELAESADPAPRKRSALESTSGPDAANGEGARDACDPSGALDGSDEDFQPVKRHAVSFASTKAAQSPTPPPPPPPEDSPSPLPGSRQAHTRPPKIYYCTRTHKQIAQMIRELRRTKIPGTTMTILSSRDKTCVHPKISKSSSKNEECSLAIEHHSCAYFNNAKSLSRNRSLSIWDIEELVNLGRETKGCPYFAAREMMEDVDIVFCPYNYLIDPVIRRQMGIALDGNIVILDEAHNIEDAARESMSFSLTLEEMAEAVQELESLAKLCDPDRRAPEISLQDLDKHDVTLVNCFNGLKSMLHTLMHWCFEVSDTVEEVEFEKHRRLWSGPQAVVILESLHINSGAVSRLTTYASSIEKFRAEESSKDPHDSIIKIPPLSSRSSSLIERLLLVLSTFFMDGKKYMDDYKVVLLKTAVTASAAASSSSLLGSNRSENQRRVLGQARKGKSIVLDYEAEAEAGSDAPGAKEDDPRRKNGSSVAFGKRWVFSLNFWCLNPGACFRLLTATTRSVILTSGTLSPMTSFASELGTDFPVRMEGSHVVHPSQLWIGAIGVGPSGRPLNGTFRSADSFDYQDEVGRLVSRVCATVPHGVLCFFSSYSMLEKMSSRWRTTGALGELERVKVVFCEPKSSEKGEFEELMAEFQEVIKQSSAGKASGTATAAAAATSKSESGDYSLKDFQVTSGAKPEFKKCQQRKLPFFTSGKAGPSVERSAPGPGAARSRVSSKHASASGALLLAVCRGKVSEGIDFTDDQARAVIAVGLPFPNLFDQQVKLKREYNDLHSSRGFLSGSQWYEVQAFRALNQALGRCIRHKNDWGAVILADERMAASKKLHPNLSRWVRDNCVEYSKFEVMEKSLAQFMKHRLEAAETERAALATAAAAAAAEAVEAADAEKAPKAASKSLPSTLAAAQHIEYLLIEDSPKKQPVSASAPKASASQPTPMDTAVARQSGTVDAAQRQTSHGSLHATPPPSLTSARLLSESACIRCSSCYGVLEKTFISAAREGELSASQSSESGESFCHVLEPGELATAAPFLSTLALFQSGPAICVPMARLTECVQPVHLIVGSSHPAANEQEDTKSFTLNSFYDFATRSCWVMIECRQCLEVREVSHVIGALLVDARAPSEGADSGNFGTVFLSSLSVLVQRMKGEE